jgi:hypothetical protein
MSVEPTYNLHHEFPLSFEKNDIPTRSLKRFFTQVGWPARQMWPAAAVHEVRS